MGCQGSFSATVISTGNPAGHSIGGYCYTYAGAAKKSLKQDLPKAKDYVRPELKKLAQSLLDITKLAAKKNINKQQAKTMFQIHKNPTQMVLLTLEELGIIAVGNRSLKFGPHRLLHWNALGKLLFHIS